MAVAAAAEAGMQVPVSAASVGVGEEKKQPKGCMKMFYTHIVVVVVVVVLEDWRKGNCSAIHWLEMEIDCHGLD